MKKGTILRTVGLLLIASGIALAGYNLITGTRSDERCRDITDELIAQTPTPSPVTDTAPDSPDDPYTEDLPDYILDPMRDMPTVVIDGREYIGILRIPSQDIELPVASEWSMDDLATSPCRYSGSVYLDSMVICGHNYVTQFGRLTSLEIGDSVTFTDTEGNVFAYTVTELETVAPDGQIYMQTGDWDMTLFTCTVSGTDRVTVRCDRSSPRPMKTQ